MEVVVEAVEVEVGDGGSELKWINVMESGVGGVWRMKVRVKKMVQVWRGGGGESGGG